MQYFNRALVLLALINCIHGVRSDAVADNLLGLLTMTGPKLLETLSPNNFMADEVPGSFSKHVDLVQGFGNKMKIVVNQFTFNGAPVVRDTTDIVSMFKGASATPSNLIQLQNFVSGASVVGYSAFQMYQLHKSTKLIEEISHKLTLLHRQIKRIDILQIQQRLQAISNRIKDFRISTEVYREEVDVLLQSVADVKNMIDDAKSRLVAVLEELDQTIALARSTRNDAWDSFAHTGAVGVGSLVSFAVWGAFPLLTVPLGIVASIFSVKFKINENEAIRHLTELHGLLERVDNQEHELVGLEGTMQNIFLELKLWQARIKARDLQSQRKPKPVGNPTDLNFLLIATTAMFLFTCFFGNKENLWFLVKITLVLLFAVLVRTRFFM